MSDKKETGSLENLQTVILIFMVAVYPLVVVPGPLDYFRWPRYVLLTVFSLLALAVFFLMKNKVNLYHPSYIPLSLFMIFLFISTLLAETPIMALIGSPWRFTGLITYLSCIFLFLLASQHNNPKQILKPMIFCAVIVSLIGVMQFYGYNLIPHHIYPSGSQGASSSYSTIGNMNFFGTYVVFVLPASIIIYLEEKDKKWLLTTAVIYAGLLVSLTRGVWLAFLPVFFIIAVKYLHNKRANRQLTNTIIALVFVTVVLLPVNEWQLAKRVYTVPDAVALVAGIYDETIQAEESAYYRIYLWKKTVSLIRDNWAFGVGPDHLRINHPCGMDEDKAHNIYLEIAVTKGLFALALYLLFIILLLRRQKNKVGFLLSMMVIIYLLQGFFNIDVVQVMPLYWIVLGLLMANLDPTNNNLTKGANSDAL